MTWARLARGWRVMLMVWIAVFVFCLGGLVLDILAGVSWIYAALMSLFVGLAVERFHYSLPKYRQAVQRARDEENDRAFIDTVRSVGEWKRQNP
jgi:hypothetical protein